MSTSLPWQAEALTFYTNLYRQGELAHGYLIDDSPGDGRANCVRAIAATILCQETVTGGCQTCSACKLLSAGSHADMLWVAPEGSTQIKIEQVRSAIAWSQKTPQQGRAKVLIIDPAENMNLFATNSLLKLLEEPSGDTYLFLLSKNTAKLLPTVRSRCQILNLNTPSFSEGVEWLKGLHPELKPESLLTIYELSGQKPQVAKDIIDQGLTQFYLDCVSVLGEWIAGNTSAIVAAKTLHSKEDLAAPYDILFRATVFALRSSLTAISRQSHGFQVLVEGLMRSTSPGRLIALNTRCVTYKNLALSDHNLNPQLTLEAFLVECYRSDRDLLVQA